MTARQPPSVQDIREIRISGPWRSKSGGLLSVPFALSYAQTMDVFDYDRGELDRISRDIRGMRMFVVEDIPARGVGGGEFHRIRTEFVFTASGKVRWSCEDLHGERRELSTSRDCILHIPPFILHTFESIEPGSALVVIANTLYDVDDPATHDSYSAAAFRMLQEQYREMAR